MKGNKEREKTIKAVSIGGICANLFFAAVKFLAGSISGSIAITGDAINNASDSVSSIITLAGYAASRRRPTRKHPLGYGRIEYLSALIVALIVLLAGIECLTSSIDRLRDPSKVTLNTLAAVIILVTIAGKVALFFINSIAGKRVHSEALMASGKDALADILTSSLTLLAAAASPFTDIPLDGIAGIVVSLFIFAAAASSISDTSSAIMGERPDRETVDNIRAIIATHPPLKGGYDIMLHAYGPERIMGTCNVEVPSDAIAENIFDAMTDAQNEIREKMGISLTFGLYAVNDFLIDVKKMKKEVLETLKSTSPHVLSIHAFHIHYDRKLVHFDVVADFEVKNSSHLADELRCALEKAYPGFRFEFTVDPEYD